LHYLRHTGPEHVLAFAPTRSGKGVSLVIPTLLSYPHSVLVNDIKGENWALTAGWRQQEGQVVLRFDPTCRDGSAARYNPLLEVRPYPQDVGDAQNLATLLIDPEGTAKWDHWDRTAYDLMTGTILHQLYVGRDKSLAGCFHVLTDPSRDSARVLTHMLRAAHDPHGHYQWTDSETGQPTKTHPVVAGAARAVLNKSENERSSVVSSVISFFDLYRDPIVARNTRVCDFSLRDVMHHDRPVSLYLTTPPSDLARTRPLFRLLLSQLGHRLTEEMQGATDGYRAGHRLLFIVDEFASLGKLDFFTTALTWAAGYGIQCYLILQDLTQLDRVYGRDSSILANCHVRVAFTPNTHETAKTLSDMLGTQTVSKESRTYTGSRLSPWLGHVIASDQESQRALLTPDELLTMPERDAIIFAGGQPPIYGRKIRYYEDPEFLRRSQIPPPSRSDRLPITTHPWTHVGAWGEEQEVIEVTTGGPRGREMEGML
jgi:type IV secretion system protein VirD4